MKEDFNAILSYLHMAKDDLRDMHVISAYEEIKDAINQLIRLRDKVLKPEASQK
jgi:hypothetical protein